MATSILSAAHFQDEDAAFEYVENHLWPTGPVCPHCGAAGDKIGKLNGATTRPGLRKCYGCRKPFTVRMGTIFESSHLPLRFWLQAIHLMCASKKGISTRQIQRLFECSMKTAWHLTHRIRFAMEQSKPRSGCASDGAIRRQWQADRLWFRSSDEGAGWLLVRLSDGCRSTRNARNPLLDRECQLLAAGDFSLSFQSPPKA